MKSNSHEFLKNNSKIMCKNILSVLFITALLFTSCKKEETAEESTTEVTATDTTAITTDSLTNSNAASAQQTGTNANSVMYGQPTAVSTTAPPPQQVAKGMNPAHGQPGHRCDIEVGMPLNSPPGKPKTGQTTPQAVTQSTTVTPAMLNSNGVVTPAATPAAVTAPVVTAPGMNPPHGQEGHVCAVGVGEPLPKK